MQGSSPAWRASREVVAEQCQVIRCEGAPCAAQHMALRVLLEQSDHHSRGPQLGCTWVGIGPGSGVEGVLG